MAYVPTVNVPGYLPQNDEPPVLATAAAAWQYLADERERAEDDDESATGQPYSDTLATLRRLAAGDFSARSLTNVDGVGTVYGDRPGEDSAHALGLAYCVTYTSDPAEDEDSSYGEDEPDAGTRADADDALRLLATDEPDRAALRNVLVLYRESHDNGDQYGSVMGWLFPLAEILRRHGDSVEHYGPSPAEYASDLVPAEYGEDRVTTELWDALTGWAPSPFSMPDGTPFPVTLDAIRYAYAVLDRYRAALVAAGLDY